MSSRKEKLEKIQQAFFSPCIFYRKKAQLAKFGVINDKKEINFISEESGPLKIRFIGSPFIYYRDNITKELTPSSTNSTIKIVRVLFINRMSGEFELADINTDFAVILQRECDRNNVTYFSLGRKESHIFTISRINGFLIIKMDPDMDILSDEEMSLGKELFEGKTKEQIYGLG
jgi:hypothetical protein